MSEGPNTPPPGQQPDVPAPGQPPAGGPPPGQQPPPPSGQPAGAPPQQAPHAPQAPQQPAVGVGQPADLMTRFLAKLIDWVLIWVVLMIVFAIIAAVAIAGAIGGMSPFGGGWGIANVIGTIVTTAVMLGYFSFLESNRGQTLGKMLLKLQVQRPDGTNPTMEEAVKRNAYIGIYIVNIIPFVGWLISSIGMLVATIYIAVTINNNTTTRQGWHDEFAGGTKVIKIG